MKTEDLIELFFSKSPYDGFPIEDYSLKLDGWHSDHPMFSRMIKEIQPKLIIEVGTWLGGSALTCAEILKENDLPTPVVCIDTWLGAQEFWKDISHNERYRDLDLDHGYPRVFHQFLANVLHKNAQNHIVPLPQTSSIAARLLMHHEIQADLIYIDGSHDQGDVMADLESYWPLLRAGGVMFGDDFDEFWPGLIHDVIKFQQQNGLELIRDECFWSFKKSHDHVEQTIPEVDQDMRETTALRIENAMLRSRLLSLEATTDNSLRVKEEAIRKLLRELEAAYTKAGNMEHTAGYFAWERDQLKAKIEELETEMEQLRKDCAKE